MTPTILLAVAITGIVALAAGICLGMSLQWKHNSKRIKRLEKMHGDAHHEMIEQEWCCERVKELTARIKELEEDDDWGDIDQFETDELMMGQAGSVN